MGKLRRYAKVSEIMVVNVTFGSEQFIINLYEELVVDENTINKEIKEQPNHYAFLGMLYKKLIRLAADTEKEMEKKFSEVYVKYKEKINDNTGRVYDKEYAQHIANASPKYQELRTKFLKLKADAGDVDVCVKAFEQRKDLIQTLSANIRKGN